VTGGKRPETPGDLGFYHELVTVTGMSGHTAR
jgi:hypothetical protein